MTSAHIDTFAQEHLPAPELQPDFLFQLPELQYPEQLNCAVELLDRQVEQGRGGRTCIRDKHITWTYQDLLAQANRVANVLRWRWGWCLAIGCCCTHPTPP